jgi:thiol-disulfide isomerase/thioredoxin
MRAWRWGLAVALFAAALAHAEQPLREWKDKPTPPLVLRDLSGHEVDLKSLQGRVVLVNFWATWCEPCIAEMPSLQRLKAKLDGKPFEVLAVNYAESSAKVQAWLRKSRVTLHVLLDPDNKASDDWGAKGLPMTFLVDTSGRVRYQTYGERDWSAPESLATVEKMVAEGHHAGR